MVDIDKSVQNVEVIKKLQDVTLISPMSSIPKTLAQQIIPVLNVDPIPLVFFKTGNAIDSDEGLIHTTSSTKRTFIVGASLTVAKDVAHTGVSSTINAQTIGKIKQTIVKLNYEPLTAGNLNAVMNLLQPIELEKSSDITATNNLIDTSIDTGGTVHLYELEEF